MIQTLCYKCVHKKGYHALSLRQAELADKCDECGSENGALSSDKRKKSPNGHNNKAEDE